MKPLPMTAKRCLQSGDRPQALTGADTLIGATCVMRFPSELSYTYTSPVVLPYIESSHLRNLLPE